MAEHRLGLSIADLSRALGLVVLGCLHGLPALYGLRVATGDRARSLVEFFHIYLIAVVCFVTAVVSASGNIICLVLGVVV